MTHTTSLWMNPMETMTLHERLPLTTLQDATIELFRTRLRGASWRPGEAGYDEARRIWNGAIDRRPGLIVQCLDEPDVVACVHFVRAHGLRFAVRGGGHNVAGSALCDGGLVVDLRAMRGVTVDAEARRAYAQGGATIGDVDQAAQPYGLAAPMGVVTETGIGGLTLGGGLGWLRRKHGLSCDALRAATVVTADGAVVRTSAAEHPDLFWAIRGGGGNFGIVTRFEYELYEVGPEVQLLFVAYPIREARRVLGALRDFMRDAPEAFSPLGVLGYVPPAPFFPEAAHGEPMVVVLGPWIGEVAEGERVLAPLRRLAAPIADLSGPMPFLEVQQVFDEDYPEGDRYYWTSAYLAGLPDGAIDRLAALMLEAPSTRSTFDVWFNGGAMGRVPAAATGFGDRGAPMLLGIEANWSDPATDAEQVAWGRRVRAAMAPFSTGAAYLNFPGSTEEGTGAAAITFGQGYARLQAVKQRYDPMGLFQTHQNVVPA